MDEGGKKEYKISKKQRNKWENMNLSEEQKANEELNKPPREEKSNFPSSFTLAVSGFPALEGTYSITGFHNNRPIYLKESSDISLFFSKRFKDWKFSDKVEDASESCFGYSESLFDKFPSLFVLDPQTSKFLKAQHVSLSRIVEPAPVSEYLKHKVSLWSIEKLKGFLEERGIAYENDRELVELVCKNFDTPPQEQKEGEMKGTEKLWKRIISELDVSDDPTVKICSRKLSKKAFGEPPVLDCTVNLHGNRVEDFRGKLSEVESWLNEYGVRKRLYGLYVLIRGRPEYACSLEWTRNKFWGLPFHEFQDYANLFKTWICLSS